MTMTRWDPMQDMRTLTRRLERAFEPLTGDEPGAFVRAIWPMVDIYEDKDEIFFRADLPGVDRNNVEISVEDGTLILKGSRQLDKEDKRDNYQRIESLYGSFTRTFQLPGTADYDRVRADMKNGVLEIHIPKREGARGKSIPIN
ncbi:MAG: Hsp20/alpha crystallin family protein [Myxococcales bacterium]|jgi:HSP20 family protein|nr:Hsp20/alpha crystallin family protein [Myxococcales bacterium]